MDLLEYQAKEWFREMGIPILPSQRIDRPSDLKGLKIRYPVVLKSQVHTGGRGKAGGVKFVENTIDAIAAAQTIFHLPILGEFPGALLAESKYDAEREIYLAVAIDPTMRRPILLGSPQGGIDVESALEQMQQIVVEQEFSPFYARRLAVKMGLQGTLIQSVSAIVEKMYQLFVQKDLDLVEINPLGVSSTGEVMALDGKVTVNDAACDRHPEIASLVAKVVSNRRQLQGWQGSTLTVERSGNIGIVSNGASLMMATLDLVVQAGGKPAICLDLGHDDFDPPTECTHLEQGLEFLSQDKNIQVVLVNIIGSAVTEQVGEVIATFVERHLGSTDGKTTRPHFVIRLAGLEFNSVGERLAALGVLVEEKLDTAVSQTLHFVKSSRSKKA